MDPNHAVFSAAARHYDRWRPAPPEALPGLLCRLAGVEAPDLVVDLGSGSGLSTLPWVGQARAVVGVEPNPDMSSLARAKSASLPGVSFLQADAARTGLPDACADVVTCAQAFHWMEPAATLAEVARILRPGGVFAAYDYQWPPTGCWPAEQAYETFTARAWDLIDRRGQGPDFRQWDENRRLPVLKESGLFRFVKELWLHRQESFGAERFCELALSNGVIQAIDRGEISTETIDLESFRQAVREAIGEGEMPWVFSYHVRLGVK